MRKPKRKSKHVIFIEQLDDRSLSQKDRARIVRTIASWNDPLWSYCALHTPRLTNQQQSRLAAAIFDAKDVANASVLVLYVRQINPALRSRFVDLIIRQKDYSSALLILGRRRIELKPKQKVALKKILHKFD